MARKHTDDLIPFVSEFSAKHIPRVPCPFCERSIVAAGKPQFDEDFETVADRRHEAWEPEWVRGRFLVPYPCGACGGVTRALGRYRVDVDDDSDWNGPIDYIQVLAVEVFSPALSLVNTPEKTPDDIVEVLKAAALAWPALPGSAANLFRQAVESILTHQDIPLRGGPKNSRLSLDDRLKLFRKQDGTAADLLLAVKWIGNEGSHASVVSATEVLTAAQLLERSLTHLYEERDDLVAKAARVNQARSVSGLRTP